MAVNLSPATALGFNRPFTDPVKQTLTVSNYNREPVAFKVKTTAPKAYCVRPNSGRLEPGEHVEIQVILQPMKEDPPPSAKCKDKFLVQSLQITPAMVDVTLPNMWAMAESDPGSNPVHQQRLKVVFHPPEGYLPNVEEHANVGMDSTFLSVNDSRYDTSRSAPMHSALGNGLPHKEPGITDVHAHGDYDRGTSPAPDFHDAPHMEDVVHIPAPVTTLPVPPPVIRPPTPPVVQQQSQMPVPVQEPVPPPPAPVAVPVPPPAPENVELKSKYSEAQEEIARLRAMLASYPDPNATEGLRERKRKLADGDETVFGGDEESTFSSGDSGVPPQVVAIIALVVFTLTYLFF